MHLDNLIGNWTLKNALKARPMSCGRLCRLFTMRGRHTTARGKNSQSNTLSILAVCFALDYFHFLNTCMASIDIFVSVYIPSLRFSKLFNMLILFAFKSRKM